MKFNKAALTGVAGACLLALNPAQAADSWLTVYGKINISIELADEAGDDSWEVESNASRFGVKGKGEVTTGIEGFYQLEWEVDVTDDAKSSDDHIKARNQVVGLRGGFGEVFVGRHDTPMKKLQKKIDLFNDLRGDIKHSINGENREDNAVQYTTPKFGFFKAKAMLLPGEDASGGNDGLADGTSISLEFTPIKNLFVGIAFDQDVDGEGVDSERVVVQYKFGDFQVGGLFQQADNNGVDADAYMLSGKYTTGKHTLKAQFIDSDVWETGISSKIKWEQQSSLGYDYKLGKSTKLYTFYTFGDVVDFNDLSTDDDSYLGFGIEQKF